MCEATLYQTRGGAFFVQEHISLAKDEDGEETGRVRFKALSRDEAEKWFMTGGVEVYSNPFGDDPPEAAAETAPGATIYVRVPALLKRRVEAAAEEAKLSANAYVLRCLEQCLPRRQRAFHAQSATVRWALKPWLEVKVAHASPAE